MSSPPLTPSERKRAERENKRALGLRAGEVWALPDDWKLIREIEQNSRKKASKGS